MWGGAEGAKGIRVSEVQNALILKAECWRHADGGDYRGQEVAETS
jgi:hypothetical protein